MHKLAGVLVIVILTFASSEPHQHHPNEQVNHGNHLGDQHVGHAHPKYEYEYGVHDPHTRDMKKQWEIRDGDVVKGSYKLVQPDGRIRVVNYYSDDKTGFNAHVHFQGESQHPSVHYESKPESQPTFGAHFTGCAIRDYSNVAGPTQNIQQTSHLHSALSKGYSTGLAGGLDPHVHGFDVREPHEYEVEEHTE